MDEKQKLNQDNIAHYANEFRKIDGLDGEANGYITPQNMLDAIKAKVKADLIAEHVVFPLKCIAQPFMQESIDIAYDAMVQGVIPEHATEDHKNEAFEILNFMLNDTDDMLTNVISSNRDVTLAEALEGAKQALPEQNNYNEKISAKQVCSL